MEVRVKAPATCGEIIQGCIKGHTFHVTCPIDWFAELTIKLNPQDKKIIYPGGYQKAALAFRKTLEYLDFAGYGGAIIAHQRIPMGKGMASSTADISAVCFGVAAALGKTLTPWEVAKIALEIEPTDGLMFPGINLFDHRQGELHEYLGPAPKMGIIIVDLGGAVDTVKFNQRADLMAKNLAKESEIKRALQLVKQGIARGDVGLLAEAATVSALANQDILAKPYLMKLMQLATEFNCLGVNVAHSGTVAGMLYDPGQVETSWLQGQINQALDYQFRTWSTRLIDGGVQILDPRKGENGWNKCSIFTEETLEPPRISLA